MRYMSMLIVSGICGTLSLHAEEQTLSKALLKAGEKKKLVRYISIEENKKKKSRFIFKDTYSEKNISNKKKKKSESYTYSNKPKFQFKFNDGSEESNLMGRHGISSSPSRGGGKGRGR